MLAFNAKRTPRVSLRSKVIGRHPQLSALEVSWKLPTVYIQPTHNMLSKHDMGKATTALLGPRHEGINIGNTL
jgi:hypothetical protein